jgi:hypothetical protein
MLFGVATDKFQLIHYERSYLPQKGSTKQSQGVEEEKNA